MIRHMHIASSRKKVRVAAPLQRRRRRRRELRAFLCSFVRRAQQVVESLGALDEPAAAVWVHVVRGRRVTGEAADALRQQRCQPQQLLQGVGHGVGEEQRAIGGWLGLWVLHMQWVGLVGWVLWVLRVSYCSGVGWGGFLWRGGMGGCWWVGALSE
jgi:hypothetical protein